ncbi:hypothetical protein SAMN04487936_102202 [Halobacillus dabanensis]|uniref:Uncharacterized protein n=1 Tax=Halobacillus dabanensis TaxID=240302 RepID=A0A1I3RGS3_HALDA|nr:hypothetical protein SAMN04487936_102202 [Halobacillus dabanensis]
MHILKAKYERGYIKEVLYSVSTLDEIGIETTGIESVLYVGVRFGTT